MQHGLAIGEAVPGATARNVKSRPQFASGSMFCYCGNERYLIARPS
jgi:hypothetical protein